LGFRLVPVNAEPSGYLAREPEPRPRTASHLGSIIEHVNGDIGFALNSDCSRFSIVTEDCETASEEYSLPLIARHVLQKRAGTLVTNICTTRTVDQVAEETGSRVVKTPVGQAHIVARLIDEQGVIGGEGSGSVVVPSFSRACDGFLMMGLVLEAMAQSGKSVGALVKSLPRYQIVKRAYNCRADDAYNALNRLKRHLADEVNPEQVTLIDGVRIDWPNAWAHVRTSRTNQQIRIISEAATMDLAEDKNEEIYRLLNI
jgi:phosphomannomutase